MRVACVALLRNIVNMFSLSLSLSFPSVLNLYRHGDAYRFYARIMQIRYFAWINVQDAWRVHYKRIYEHYLRTSSALMRDNTDLCGALP